VNDSKVQEVRLKGLSGIKCGLFFSSCSLGLLYKSAKSVLKKESLGLKNRPSLIHIKKRCNSEVVHPALCCVETHEVI